jgi:aspartyl-tRNA(Asn)/glutamyl-tRNA(Gln) amidotransferase subunit B
MKIAKLKNENYALTVGLEVHAELKTQTKMFCNSKNDPDEKRSNLNICPVCMGYPGTLPVINKEAVRSVLRFGVAVGGDLADYTEFDRKNYFYPDIPKGYQISQYKYPLVRGGSLAGVSLTRIHLEEDTAKSTHNSQLTTDNSLLDFNRAGVPLMELVTEPVIHEAEEAADFARELQLVLRYLGMSEANMEKGEMRIEANISVRNDQTTMTNDQLGTKVEVKNLNSFRAVEKAIKYEFERQIGILEKGEQVLQETRGWDEEKEETFSQRTKEDSHDYRYFPDPDLPKLYINEIPDFAPEALGRTMPELPQEKRERYKKDFGIKDQDIEIYVRDGEWGKFFEEVAVMLKDHELVKLASNYITSDLKSPIPIEALVEVIMMISRGEISSRGAKDILKIIQEDGGEPKQIAKEKNLLQISDKEVLKKLASEVLKENTRAPIQFLVGQAMKKSKNRANPVMLQKLFLEMLDH